MNLSENEILELVKSKGNSSLIDAGERYHSRLRMLTEPLNAAQLEDETAFDELRAHLEDTLTSKKYKRVMQFFTYPLSVVNVTNDVLSDLYKVFDARNSNFNIQYPNDRAAGVMGEIYNAANLRGYMERIGKRVLKAEPNLIVVVDKDEEGKPYLLEVDEHKLIDVSFTACGKYFKYIIFEHSQGADELGEYTNIALYCDEFYTVVQDRDGVASVLMQNPHGLGYCPARFFFDKPLSSRDKFNRFSYFAPVLGALYDWLKFYSFKEYADHYGAFPVIEQAYTECSNEHCNNGYISYPLNEDSVVGGGYTTPVACGACSDRSLIGPGTTVRVELDPEGGNDSRGVLRFIAPDLSGLQYVANKLNEKENFIKVNTVGYNNVLSKEAVNAVQIRGLMESKKKPLLDIKTCLDDTYKWIVYTFADAYGVQGIECHADFGTEWFILTESDVLEMFEQAKKAGLPDGELQSMYTLLIETKYKTNPAKVERMKLLAELDPYPYDSLLDLKEKFGLGMVSTEGLKLKGNFVSLINRFEREQGDVVAYAEDLPRELKINRILDTLKTYLDESEQLNPSDEGTIGAGGGLQNA